MKEDNKMPSIQVHQFHKCRKMSLCQPVIISHILMSGLVDSRVARMKKNTMEKKENNGRFENA
jgi:hypothetical protein